MRTLGIFLKRPVSGQVKTRLGREIGLELAAELYAAFQADLLDRLQNFKANLVLAYAPADDASLEHFAPWLRSGADFQDQLWPQPAGSLGARMAAFFESFVTPGNAAVLIGSDSPNLPNALLESAFAELESESCDVVLSPACDGGYVLVGQREFVPEMFQAVNWSSADVLLQTVRRLQAHKRSLSLLPPWYDIDTAADLKVLHGHLTALDWSGDRRDLPQRTQQMLSRYIADEDS